VDYAAAIRILAPVRGICEVGRPAASIDLVHDRDSRAAGVKVQCPMPAAWGDEGNINRRNHVLGIWPPYCAHEVPGDAIDSGPYIAEENPGELLDWFRRFVG
jgi:haloacetate dehalogenase